MVDSGEDGAGSWGKTEITSSPLLGEAFVGKFGVSGLGFDGVLGNTSSIVGGESDVGDKGFAEVGDGMTGTKSLSFVVVVGLGFSSVGNGGYGEVGGIMVFGFAGYSCVEGGGVEEVGDGKMGTNFVGFGSLVGNGSEMVVGGGTDVSGGLSVGD